MLRFRARIIVSLVFVLVSLPLLPTEHVHAMESPDGSWHTTVHAHASAGEHCHHAHADHHGSGPVFERGAPETFESHDITLMAPKRPSGGVATPFVVTGVVVIPAPREVTSLTYEPERYNHGPPRSTADPRGPPAFQPAL